MNKNNFDIKEAKLGIIIVIFCGEKILASSCFSLIDYIDIFSTLILQS